MHIIEKWVLLFYWEKNEKKKKMEAQECEKPKFSRRSLTGLGFLGNQCSGLIFTMISLS